MSDFDKWCDKYWEESNNFPSADEAWNHQQQKIDAIKSKLHDIYDACDENETVEGILDSIKELLK